MQTMTYSLNKSRACMRRVMKLKLSDSQITDLLRTNEGRRAIGYQYLVSDHGPIVKDLTVSDA